MTDSMLIAGKPLSRFYKLPFEKGSRILTKEVLEAHTDFRTGKNPYYQVAYQLISFRYGLMTMRMRLETERAVKVYYKVEYDHLLISCSVDTDKSYLSRYAYRTLRAMMWEEEINFQEYYWPECFNASTGRSIYLHVIRDRYGMDIKLKENFKGFFRPDDLLPDLRERVVVDREPIKSVRKVTNLLKRGIGYCLANTDLEWFHSNHYPFLIPYIFVAKADFKNVKSFERFVFENGDTDDVMLTGEQLALNQICFEMKRLAPVQFRKSGDITEREEEINRANGTNKDKLLRLWHQVMPQLVSERFSHYLFTYGLRNIERRPMKKLMQPAGFSMDVPKLSFLLTDKGDYFELFLRFRIKGRILQFGETQALFIVCAKQKPGLWYLLEAELDVALVAFFVKIGFKIQVPKTYYAVYFERYLYRLQGFYELIYR